MYAYASSQLMYLRFRRTAPNEKPPAKLHDPPALEARPGAKAIGGYCETRLADMRRVLDFIEDVVRSILSFPKVIPDILLNGIPYAIVLATFGAFVVWNGGIVLGKC